LNARTKRNLLIEAAQALICERLIRRGLTPGMDPIWLARLLVARTTATALLMRLRRR
jgi:hypothetical protein